MSRLIVPLLALSFACAAEELGVSRATAYRLRKRAIAEGHVKG